MTEAAVKAGVKGGGRERREREERKYETRQNAEDYPIGRADKQSKQRGTIIASLGLFSSSPPALLAASVFPLLSCCPAVLLSSSPPSLLPSPVSGFSLRMAATTERAAFEAVFPSLAQDVLAHAKKYNLPENAMQWFEKVRFPGPHAAQRNTHSSWDVTRPSMSTSPVAS